MSQLSVPEGMKRNVVRNELDAYFIQHIRKAIGNGKYASACWCDGIWRRRDINSQTPSPMYATPEPIDQKFQRTAEQSKPAESGERIIDGEKACVDAEGRSSFNELLFKSAKMLGPLDVECVNLLHAGVAEQERRIVGS
jgi:hypothetical protein